MFRLTLTLALLAGLFCPGCTPAAAQAADTIPKVDTEAPSADELGALWIAEDEEEVDPGFPMHLLPTASGGEDEMKL